MVSPKWDRRFLYQALEISKWSKDPSTQVGAVITDEYNRKISEGYNGLPMGLKDSNWNLDNRELKLSLTIHAEINAILFAQRPLKGMTLYTTHFPCPPCAIVILQVGIARVVSYLPSKDYLSRWSEKILLSKQVFSEGGVHLYTYRGPEIEEKRGIWKSNAKGAWYLEEKCDA
jgi:dCMP deaminase